MQLRTMSFDKTAPMSNFRIACACRAKVTLLALVLVANIIYLIWRICATLPHGEGWLSFFFALGLLAAELLGLFELCVTLDGICHQSVPPLPTVSHDCFPAVDVFIATYNEDAALLRKTVKGCKAMQYPHPQKVQIYLCDDGNRPAIKALAASLGVHYFARSGNHGAKAGNLNNALRHSSAPLIATFDADMIPTPQFLLQTVPYFCVGARLGFVQTPQSFYNPDLFQQNFRAQQHIPNEQDYFYRKVQLTKNHGNTVIYGGSNTLLSRAALAVFGVKVVDCTLREVLCIFLPTYLLTNAVLVGCSGGFSVTDKSGVPLQDTAYAHHKARVFWVYIILSLIGVANVFLYSGGYQSFNFVVVLGWLVVNLLYLIMALVFVCAAPVPAPVQNKMRLAKTMAGRGCLLFDLLRALR